MIMGSKRKIDFLRGFSEYSGYTLAHCTEIYRLLEKYIADELSSGNEVRITGVCTLGTKVRPPFVANDLVHGGKTEYPEKVVPYCNFYPAISKKVSQLPCN